MNILLTTSPGPLYATLNQLTPPTGLLYLAAVLEQAGHRVRVLDAMRDGLDAHRVAKNAAAGGADVVGVSVLTDGRFAAFDLIRALRCAVPNARLVMGGAHATLDAVPTMHALPELDALAVGEGEVTVGALAAYTWDGTSVAGALLSVA